jgi:CDP-diacylglycerol---serine O-phosphatidyltransferase
MTEHPTPEGQSRRRRLGRSVFVIPSLFTVGNIFCGYSAILACMHGNYVQASYAIGIAIILDSVDGFVARLTNSSSSFGLQLDSLADVISFGIAPSVLAFVWGLSAAERRLALVAAFTFTICGAMRLARFNVQAGNLKHFVGLPIPAGGGAIAAVVHFFEAPVKTQMGSNLMVAGVFVLSFLMISTLRYNSLKNLALGKKSHLVILVMALLVALIFYYSKWTLLVLAAGYCLSGPVLRLCALVRRKKPGDDMALAESMQHR